MRLESQDYKSFEAGEESPENLFKKGSTHELRRITARIHEKQKNQIEELAENSGFHSQASVIREALRIALPKLRRGAEQ